MAVDVPSRFASLSDGMENARALSTRARCIDIQFLPTTGRVPSFDPNGFRYTEHNKRIAYQKIDAINGSSETMTFRPDWAPALTDARKRRGWRPHSVEIVGGYAPDADSGIVLEDLVTGRIIGARVTVYDIDYRRPYVESPFVDVYYVSARKFDRNEYRLYCDSVLARLAASRGNTETRTCRRNLGDDFCKVDLDDQVDWPEYRVDNAFTVVTAFTNRRTITVDWTPVATTYTTGPGGEYVPTFFQADWFAFGRLIYPQIAGDPNSGQIRQIQASSEAENPPGAPTKFRSTLVLNVALPGNIVSNVPLTVYVGCDKRRSTCLTKFPIDATYGNLRQFGGAHEIIGNDRLIKTGDGI